MASPPKEAERRRGRLVFTGVFQRSIEGIRKNEKEQAETPTLTITIENNLDSEKSESEKKPISSQTQAKPLYCPERQAEKYRIHNDKSRKSNKFSSNFKNCSNTQDKSYVPKLHNYKKQNNIQRKYSYCDSEAKVDTEAEGPKDFIVELSGIKHHRVMEETQSGTKISFKNELLSKPTSNLRIPSTSLPPASSVISLTSTQSASSLLPAAPISVSNVPSTPPVRSLHSTPSVSSFPSTQSVASLHSTPSVSNLPSTLTASSLSPAASVSSIPLAVPDSISCLPSTPVSVSNLPSAPSVSSLQYAPSASGLPPLPSLSCFPPAVPVSSLHLATSNPRLSAAPPHFSVPPVPHSFNVPPPNILSCVSNSSKHTDCNNTHLPLYSEKECFIPPPVTPPAINSFDSTGTSLESSPLHNVVESTVDVLPFPEGDEVLPPIPDSEHLEAISNFILAIVKERTVTSSFSAITVVRDLNALFRNHFEGNVIEVYGSYDSDLAISTSDINLVVLADISIRKSFMFEVYKILSSELEKYHVHPFEEGTSAHQTKINFTHPDSGINCQLAYLGKYKKNIFKMGRFLKLMSSVDNRVKKLIIATKIWAECLAINEVEDGKLHSVGYALLVIHFLQHCENPILPVLPDLCDDEEDKICPSTSYAHTASSIPNTLSVGELWMAFLRYYSETFNWKKDVVTVTSESSVSKKSKQWETYWMAIEDPFTGKNIAASVTNCDIADYIMACFKSSYVYFCNPPETMSVCSSDAEIQNNGDSASCKYEFSFQQCIAEQSDAFCERCEEIDDVCDECKKKIYVQPMASVPKMTDDFLRIIKMALMTIYNKYMLSNEEIDERKLFVKKLQKNVCQVYPDAELNLFGSSTNGFGFKNSDLDICITFKTKKVNSDSVLINIRKVLRRDNCFSNVVVIFTAQIPIIKFIYQPKGWRGDISLDNTLAVHNSQLLYTYSLIDVRCRVLGCALKLLAKKALVAEVTEKALSSYSYLNMVIHFLQQIEPPVLPVLQDNKFRENNFRLDHIVENCNVWFCKDLTHIKRMFKQENVIPVEQLWLDLLDYYCSFDSNQFITIRQKETQYINDIKHSARLFNIQDPFIETKNLGCVVSAKKAEETKSVIKRARQLFRTPVKEFPSGVKDIEDYFFSTMSLTGRIHKEAHCDLCGKFGHEKKECKHSCFPLRRPNFRQFQKYRSYNQNRNANTYRKPMNRPPYIKQFSL